MLPSERVEASGRHRIRALSYRVWVCGGCRFVSDMDPGLFRMQLVAGRVFGPNVCPKCGAQALWRETRRKD